MHFENQLDYLQLIEIISVLALRAANLAGLHKPAGRPDGRKSVVYRIRSGFPLYGIAKTKIMDFLAKLIQSMWFKSNMTMLNTILAIKMIMGENCRK